MNQMIKDFLIEHNLPQPRSIRKLSSDVYTSIVDSTHFLKDDVPFGQRVYCVFHNIKEQPNCLCGQPVTNSRNNLEYGSYAFSPYCSVSCTAKATSSKRKQTCLEKYGVEYPAQSSQIKQNLKQYNLDKYGAEHFFQSRAMKEKSKQTNLERYGVEHHFLSKEIRAKRDQTVRDRYGVDNVYQADDVKEKIKATMTDRYGSDNALKVDHIKERVQRTNIERYGGICPTKSNSVIDKAKRTNQERYSVDNYMKFHLSDEAIEVMSNKDKMQNLYDEQKSLRACADHLNVRSHRTIYEAMQRLGVETINTRSVSNGERSVCEFLTENNIQFIKSDRKLIAPKEVDILCEDYRLAIEYNGLHWHSHEVKADRLYHQNKTSACVDKGYKLIHIFEDEWADPIKQEIIKEKILNHCHKSNRKRIFARQCVVESVNSIDLKDFYHNNHIQSYIDSSFNYVLSHSDVVVAALSLKKTAITGRYYISRYATSENVLGGFSKLLKHAERTIDDIKSFVTYANLQYSSGDMYLKIGFEKIRRTKPNYFYVKNSVRYSRQQFMKHKLQDKLDIFDPTRSEYENMLMNGYSKIYDCGSMLYYKELPSD